MLVSKDQLRMPGTVCRKATSPFRKHVSEMASIQHLCSTTVLAVHCFVQAPLLPAAADNGFCAQSLSFCTQDEPTTKDTSTELKKIFSQNDSKVITCIHARQVYSTYLSIFVWICTNFHKQGSQYLMLPLTQARITLRGLGGHL